MTLMEFLKAQLDEDVQAAQAATLQRWRVDTWANDAGREFLVVADEEAGAPAFGIKSERDAAHIARHDPARVLAEVDAKRRIVERHGHNERSLSCTECGGFTSTTSEVYGIVHSGYVTPWPCPTLRLLALPYADHPDYDEAWRPQA